ncbi:trans-sialidase, putative, partial [Trypanosoma cruzi marinkellei]
MHSRVAAVKAPCTHNRRRVTGSSGMRREGRESEQQRPNMSRRVFVSAVLLLLLVMMCCNTGGTAAAVKESTEPTFEWKDITDAKVSVDSLGVPGLLNVGSDVFAVAEAQFKKGESNTFTGVASQLLTAATADQPEEVLTDPKDTKVLEEVTSTEPKKRVDVSRPTAVVEGSNIYMLVGKYTRTAASCQGDAATAPWGLLLVKGMSVLEKIVEGKRIPMERYSRCTV